MDYNEAIAILEEQYRTASMCVSSSHCLKHNKAIKMAIEALKKQIQSEESFEWCTDCKEYDQEKHCCHRFSKIINQTVEEVRGTTAIGEWVKAHGFVTPGGDPVWRCSNCGKGIHVFGVEHHSYGADIADNQWVACPNCGAIMIGERDG